MWFASCLREHRRIQELDLGRGRTGRSRRRRRRGGRVWKAENFGYFDVEMPKFITQCIGKAKQRATFGILRV